MTTYFSQGSAATEVIVLIQTSFTDL